MSADEFLRLHGDESGIELIDGQIVWLPRPGLEHGVVCANAVGIIRSHVKAHRLGGVCSNDSFVRLSTDRVYQTMPADVPTPKGAFAPLLDLVVEVKSPTERGWPQRFHNGDTLALPDILPEFAVPVKQFFV